MRKRFDEGKCSRFSYPNKSRLDATLLFLISIPVLTIIMMRRGEFQEAIIFVVIACAFYLPLYLNAKFLTSDVCISDSGARWRLYNVPWRSLAWRDVKRIRVLESYNVAARRKVKVYSIDRSGRKAWFLPKGPIVFDSTIGDFGDLIDCINGFVEMHHIPVKSFLRVRNGEWVARLE